MNYKSEANKTKKMGIHLYQDDKIRLDNLAKYYGQSPSWVIRKAINKLFKSSGDEMFEKADEILSREGK